MVGKKMEFVETKLPPIGSFGSSAIEGLGELILDVAEKVNEVIFVVNKMEKKRLDELERKGD